jgi:hydrogenase maturation factor
MEAQLSIHIAHQGVRTEINAKIGKYQVSQNIAGASVKDVMIKALASLLNQMANDDERIKRAYRRQFLLESL